jgi:hypothetical protein
MKEYVKQNWFLLFTVLVLLSIIITKQKNEKVLSGNPDVLNVKTESYKLKNGQVVNTSKTVVYNKAPEKTELTKQFSKVKTIIKIVERVRIDTVRLVYKDSIPCQFERTGSLVNSDYSLDYKSNQKGISITDFELQKDTTNIVFGEKRKWIFGKTTNTIDMTHTNKLIEVQSINHYEIVPKQKFYKNPFFLVGIGFLGGVLLTK